MVQVYKQHRFQPSGYVPTTGDLMMQIQPLRDRNLFVTH